MTAQVSGVAEGAGAQDMVAEFEKLDLQAGDILVMRFKYHLEPEIVKELTKKLYASLPPGVRCLVVDPTIEVSIHKTSAEEE